MLQYIRWLRCTPARAHAPGADQDEDEHYVEDDHADRARAHLVAHNLFPELQGCAFQRTARGSANVCRTAHPSEDIAKCLYIMRMVRIMIILMIVLLILLIMLILLILKIILKLPGNLARSTSVASS